MDFWLNAFLYSDEVVSHKSHNDGKLEFFVILSITLSSKLIVFIVRHYLDKLTDLEDRINLVKEIHIQSVFLRIFKKFKKEILIKVITFFILALGFIFYSFYYLFVFCTIYRKSQMSLLKNYIASMLEDLLYGVGFVVIIIGLRKLSFCYKNKYVYNTSKFIDNYF